MTYLKSLLLLIFNIIIFFILILKYLRILSSNRSSNYKIFFGGARMGNIGGTLTKIKKLKSFYGESLFNFNIVYLMSNTPYLFKINLYIINKLKIPIIHNQNGLFYPSWYKGDYRLKNKQIYKQYICADYIFFQSNFCKKISLKYLNQPKCNNEILYNAVDTNFYKPKKIKKNFSNYSFLITGKFNFNLRNSLIDSIEGIKKCNDEGYSFNLNIYGYLDNRLKNLLEKKIIDLKLKDQIFIKGTYIQENANLIYNNNDAFIFLIYKAPCSNSVLEALSCGLPIVYSDSGGTKELVGDAGVGLKVDDSYKEYITPKIDDIKNGMILIYKDHENKAKNARKRAEENFSIEKWFYTHSKIMNKLLND